MCKASTEPGGPLRCSGDARRNCESSQIEFELLSRRAEQLGVAADAIQAQEQEQLNSVLCRSCWQAAIMSERKTGVSRLRGYRRRHPHGAQGQCGGKPWW